MRTTASSPFAPPGDSRVRTLHYFSLKLRNDGLRKENAFLEFVRAAHPDVGYLKSASYLMHESDFSTIRDTLLTQCRTIIQDDSGIPLRCFNSECWHFLNFGVYAPTLDIFKKYNQPEMADLYAKLPAAPLPFGAGYHIRQLESHALGRMCKSRWLRRWSPRSVLAQRSQPSRLHNCSV